MQSFCRSFTVLPTIDSTNNYAMRLIHARLAKHRDAFFALEQTEGKGQRGRAWESKKGESILMSIVLTPTFLAPTQSFLLSAAIAVATYDFFRKYSGDETRIKWPNDIYYNDRKAGGILIENRIQAKNWQFAVVGLGININQPEFAGRANRPISLRQITGMEYDVTSLGKALCTFVGERYSILEGGGEALILRSYNQALYKRNERVRLIREGAALDAVVKGVTDEGQLIIETAGSRREECAWGSVEWVLPEL